MKLRPPPPRAPAGRDAMLPLINVTFLLITFFLLAGHLRTQVSGSAPSASGTVAVQTAPEHLDALAALTLGGHAVWAGHAMDDEELLRHARAWAQAHPGARLGLRASNGMPARRIVQLISQLQAVGCREVTVVPEP